ncbi:hypothetical protein C8034_v003644 [Colletotrichum sidae]|uniref:Proteasome assembly chaperone 3 n=2 Tax=Colletotrichum orbiculare species complex TaxID=2707354 RepID=N4VIJ1_COLOR|nr:hypothetical protein Cob_v005606 [Colletotrichum orbiculare MAFF 240422]TEA14255.1 hypothetical protein C8034_v003644 [Colletotrichum sidae]
MASSIITQLSLPLPRSLDTRIHIHLTIKAKAVTLFLTSTTQDEPASTASLGSFVYALPNKLDPAQPLSTAIYSVESTLEFSTRMAKLLAKRASMPVYVGCSMNLAGGGGAMSLSVEEEMEAFRAVVDVVMTRLKAVNGVSAS